MSLQKETLETINAYTPPDFEEFISWDDRDSLASLINTFQVYILRAIEGNRDPSLHIQDYRRMRMHRLSPLSQSLANRIWLLTEHPDENERAPANIKNLALRKNEKSVRETLRKITSKYTDLPLIAESEGLYAINDRFLASGLLLGHFPKEWLRRLEDGSVASELSSAFRLYPVGGAIRVGKSTYQYSLPFNTR